MAIDVLKNVKVCGIASCVPENIIKTEALTKKESPEFIEKFIRTTGVVQRRCCTTNPIITSADLCYQAANKLIEALSIDRSTIDALIFVTQSPDYYFEPATACVLQYRLGLSNDCLAYDVTLGCSGYIYGLHIAASHLQSGRLRKVLLLTGEASSHTKTENIDIFGDAGAATLIEVDGTAESAMEFKLETMGNGYKCLIMPYGGYRHGVKAQPGYLSEDFNGYQKFESNMDGPEVFNYSIREVPRLVNEYLEFFQHDMKDFDLVVFHQANLIILNQIRKRLKIPKEMMPISIDIYGNTSSASIPLGICDYFQRLNPSDRQKRKNILMCGFGIGLSQGVTGFSIDGAKCLPVFTTKEGFNDGFFALKEGEK